jgi:sigma-B regulation protein RsbU (phosphoserine phosphatase)
VIEQRPRFAKDRLGHWHSVTEAMNAADEEFGEDRLQAVLAEFAPLSAEGLRAAVIERVRAWSAGAPQSDDLTFLVLKMR